LKSYPKAKLQLISVDRRGRSDRRTHRRRDPRAHHAVTDAALIMRTLGKSSRVLVAAPSVAAQCTRTAILRSLCRSADAGHHRPDGRDHVGIFRPRRTSAFAIVHKPRMCLRRFRRAARCGRRRTRYRVIAGRTHAARELDSGKLVHVFPQWRMTDGIVHLVFTTRRGLPPVVRAFIDHLAVAFREQNLAH
jgi:DNA-binding transcriptional LysR family regulator